MKRRLIIVLAVLLIAGLSAAGIHFLSVGEATAPPSPFQEEPHFPDTAADDDNQTETLKADTLVFSKSTDPIPDERPVLIQVSVSETTDEPAPVIEDRPVSEGPQVQPLPVEPKTEHETVTEEHTVLTPDTVGSEPAEETDEPKPTANIPEGKPESNPDADPETVPAEQPEDLKQPDHHFHSYTPAIAKQAGCEEDGLTVYTCSCGETYEDPIEKLGHNWVPASEYEVVDADGYCKLKYAVIICTSPACYENGDRTTAPLSVFSAKDYSYSASQLFETYNAHAYAHLANGEQASYTADFVSDTAPADMYDLLLSQQDCKPRSVRDLTLIPAVTHTEHTYRCSRCGAEK